MFTVGVAALPPTIAFRGTSTLHGWRFCRQSKMGIFLDFPPIPLLSKSRSHHVPNRTLLTENGLRFFEFSNVGSWT